MPGLVPGIHVLDKSKDLDGRDKSGHDDLCRQFAKRRKRRWQVALQSAEPVV